MGDPRRLKKKYSGPSHPWQKSRIEEEKTILREYGLKNKREIWKMESKLKNFAKQAKSLATAIGKQSEKEAMQLIKRMQRYGLVDKTATIDAALGLTMKDILSRRLQTLVVNKGLARSFKQARQFITHRHVAIKDKIITTPSYLVPVEEEPYINFIAKSAYSNEDHPERVALSLPIKKKEKKEPKPDRRGFRGRQRGQKSSGRGPAVKKKTAAKKTDQKKEEKKEAKEGKK